MKILFLHRKDLHHPEAAESEIHLFRIFEKIASYGHEVVMLASSFRDANEREEINGVKVVRSGRGDFLYRLGLKRQIRRLNEEFHFDIVIENLDERPLLVAKKTSLPTVVLVHQLWKTAIFRESFSLKALCIWLWELSIPSFYGRSEFIAISPSVMRELVNLGLSQKRVSLVYCGADSVPEYFAAESKKERFFLWRSSEKHSSGLIYALDAFETFSRRHPDWNFLLRIIGNFQKEKRLPYEIRRRGLGDRVLVELNASYERRMDLIRRAYCLLQTDRQQGWGYAAIEAGKCGTTTIAPDDSGYKDCIRDGVTGLLYSPEKGVQSCVKQMEHLCEDEKLRENLQANAKRYADAFHWGRTANEILAVLQKTIENR